MLLDFASVGFDAALPVCAGLALLLVALIRSQALRLVVDARFFLDEFARAFSRFGAARRGEQRGFGFHKFNVPVNPSAPIGLLHSR